jgi:hypothetical protein
MDSLNKVTLVLIVLGALGAASSPAGTRPTPTTIVPDNLVVCQSNSGCTNQTMFGRTYKVIHTDRLVVMVSISDEGSYTRADVSILNNGSYPTKVVPEDFRIEEVTPKPKILSYIAPENLQNLPAPTPEPDVKVPEAASTPTSTTPPDPAKPLDIDQLYIAKKKQIAAREAAEKAAAQKHLETTPVPPNETIRGRVYFERDIKAQLVNVVLPIGGMVYQFPYQIKR